MAEERIASRINCPHCQYHDSKVIDSRGGPDGDYIRRRRECLSCDRRFTTYEFIMSSQPGEMTQAVTALIEMLERQQSEVEIAIAELKVGLGRQAMTRADRQKEMA